MKKNTNNRYAASTSCLLTYMKNNKPYTRTLEHREKMSGVLSGIKKSKKEKKRLQNLRKGKKLTEQQKLNIKKGMIGKTPRGNKHYNWKGGDYKIISKIRWSSKYGEWRFKVFSRDNFKCIMCGSKLNKIEAHHIKKFSILVQEAKSCFPLFDLYDACMLYPPIWDIKNGETLCKKCHATTENYGNRTVK